MEANKKFDFYNEKKTYSKSSSVALKTTLTMNMIYECAA